MSIGSVTVDLLAKTGSFETDMNRAAKLAQKRAKEIDDALSKAGERVGALLGSAGLAAVYFGKQLIDGIDALNDISDATGSTVENISALEDVAMRTGTNMENVSGILVKFNNVLKEADGKNGVSLALKAIGLDVEALKKLDPAEALRVTAVALAGYAGDGNKARVQQELFGKSVKETAPFLKDLAEQTQLVGKVSAEQAAQAEAFNKQLSSMQKNAVDAGRVLLQSLLPAVSEMAEEFSIGMKMANGFVDAILTFGTINPFRSQQGNLKALREELEGLQKDRERYTRSGSDTRAIDDAIANATKKYGFLKAIQARDALANAGDTSDAVSRRFMRVSPLTSVGDVPKPATGSKVPKETELQRYIENLQKQLQTTHELSAAETVLADIQSGRLKLAKGESADRALALASELDASKARMARDKADIEGANARHDALLRDAKAQEDQVAALADSNKNLEWEIGLIGKSAEGIAAVERARISSTIALKEEQLARMTNGEYLGREAAALQEQIRLLQERGQLLNKKGVAEKSAEDARATEDLAKSLGSSFESAFEKIATGGSKASEILRGIAEDISRVMFRVLVVQPMAEKLAKSLREARESKDSGGSSDWWSDIAKALLGGADSGGGAGAGAGGGGGGDGFGTGGDFGNQDFGGFFAEGGDPPVGRPSIVGERGPEWFVPRTAGTILPNDALGHKGGGWGAPIINNYGSSRVSVTRRPDGRPEIAIREFEAALNDPNSRVSKTLQRNYNLQRPR